MYISLEQALLDLEKAGMLKRIKEEVDPYLEMAAIAREAFARGDKAILFEKVKGSRFRAACNIYGTEKRMQYLFRKEIKSVTDAVAFKANPAGFFRRINPFRWYRAAKAGKASLPLKAGSIHDFEECSLADLPQIKCWPEDGGAFITLPQVATRPSPKARILETNVGMYRIQISGNSYMENECGLHYQLGRDIARHHQAALAEGRPLKVSIFVGGPPAHAIAAIMPMPENLSELVFAGMLGGRRFRYFIHDGYVVSADADFCILGEVAPQLKPEGPFGDHIGYYSATHPFPYINVKKVLCKKNAIFPFTVVGRPPQEDTLFGKFIHQVTKPMMPASVPGVHAINAVDDAGVHSLCLALADERECPYNGGREPLGILKTANALLGFNQVSLSKYLMLAAKQDNPALDVNDFSGFFTHVLERIDFGRDLHFQTSTTIDTLDYTGTKLNHGSKLVIAAVGEPRRILRNNAHDLDSLPLVDGFDSPRVILPGTIVIHAKPDADLDAFRKGIENWGYRENYPWISLVDTTDSMELRDFVWMTFTRSDPAQDVHGLNEEFRDKHWSIQAPLIVDARTKPHHQKPLTVPDAITSRARAILDRAK
ncbi:MAG: UbiD family decarboxylase [Fibrobacter sp.]|nr:UbiD family decarboxylase [Fibrobacter sp.]